MNERRALLVEAQPDLAMLFTLQLEGLGWRVDVVGTERQALARISVAPPDAIIIDTLAPDGASQLILQEMRAALDGRPCRMVISTIYEAADFADFGADAILTLPHHVAALEQVLLAG
jgi:DNA-binding response OmpR family regulator